jgi:hypothetical protein
MGQKNQKRDDNNEGPKRFPSFESVIASRAIKFTS